MSAAKTVGSITNVLKSYLSKQIYLYLLCTNSIYVFFSLYKFKEESYGSKYIVLLCFSLKRRKELIQKGSHVAAATNLFSSVNDIGIAFFDEYFLFYVITEKHYVL